MQSGHDGGQRAQDVGRGGDGGSHAERASPAGGDDPDGHGQQAQIHRERDHAHGRAEHGVRVQAETRTASGQPAGQGHQCHRHREGR